jgi:hypothetical protein
MPGSVLCCTGLRWIYFPLLFIADPSVFFISLSPRITFYIRLRPVLLSTSSVSLPILLLGLFPIYTFKIYVQHLYPANAYDDDAARDVVVSLPPICSTASNTENAFVWTSTRLSRARTQPRYRNFGTGFPPISPSWHCRYVTQKYSLRCCGKASCDL